LSANPFVMAADSSAAFSAVAIAAASISTEPLL
jgi:hypothetical protein